jgi:uncharacterized protein (TIGR04255 family)
MMAKKIDEIQDALREHVPILQRIELRQIASNGQISGTDDSLSTSAWMLLSSDRTFGFQFTPEQVIFFSQKYIRYRDFSTLLGKGLQVLFDKMKFIDVTNLGVRYVDQIVPNDGEGLEAYVHSALLQPKFSGLGNLGGMSTWTYKANDLELKIRTNSQVGSLRYPDDLVPLLIMAHDPARQLQLDFLSESQMVLDIDAYLVNTSPNRMDLEKIIDCLERLHNEANGFFRNTEVFSDHAFEIWKKARI